MKCHGWTDKFQLFQFSFSSVAYSQVKSVRPYGGPEPKKKLTDKDRKTHRSDRRYHIKRDRWHNLSKHAVLLTLRSVRQCNVNNVTQCNVMYACNTMQSM
jgi:hypothetical protein